MGGHSYSTGFGTQSVTLNVQSLVDTLDKSGSRQQLVQTALKAARALSNELYGERNILRCMQLVLAAVDTEQYRSGTEVIDAVLDADTAKWFKAYRVTPALQALLPAGVSAGRCKAAVNAVFKLRGGTVAGSKAGNVVAAADGSYSIDTVDLCVELYDRGLSAEDIRFMLQHYGCSLTEWEVLEILNRECGYLEKFISVGNGEVVHAQCASLEGLEQWQDVVIEAEQRKWRGM